MLEAQLGSAVLLAYRKPQAQQQGNALVLNYNAGAEDPYFVPMYGNTKGAWQKTRAAFMAVQSQASAMTSASVRAQAPWDVHTGMNIESDERWPAPVLMNEGKDAPWGKGVVLEEPPHDITWKQGIQLAYTADGEWDETTPLEKVVDLLAPWGLSKPLMQLTANPWETQEGKARYREYLVNWRTAKPSSREGKYPWDRKAPSHDHVWDVIYPSGPTTDEHGTIIIPIRSSYIVLNEVTARVVADGTSLPIQSMNLNLDYGTWAWGWSATLPASYLPYLQSVALVSPIELILSVNGDEFLVLVESVSRSRELGKSSLSIAGRGQSAYLSAPYSPVLNHTNSILKTSQQLMEDSLKFNLAPIGWAVNWNIPVWNVPAGVWNFTGTYIEAVAEIAASVGAYVLPDPKFKTLNINSKYPTLPSEWPTGVPYMDLPSSVVVTEGVEWSEKPGYNGVYVTGEQAGITAFVRKNETIGDFLAEQTSHQLITHVDAARELGRSILADTGKSALVSLSMPVLDAGGLILPGNVIKYQDGANTLWGITRSIDISSSGPSLRQTIEVEVHS